MVPVTLPLGEGDERIGTPKRTCVVIVIGGWMTERADGGEYGRKAGDI